MRRLLFRSHIHDALAQSIAVAPAESEFGAARHNHAIIAAEPGLERLDAIEIHDRGSVDAEELLRVERFLQGIHGLA